MRRTYFLFILLLVLLTLGVLTSSARNSVGRYREDSRLDYFEGKRNNSLFYLTNNFGKRSVLGISSGRTVVTFTASYLIWFMFAGLGVLWVIDGRIKKEQVIHALVASFLAWLLAEFVKQIFQAPRPFMIDGLRPLTATVPLDPGFPSTHAALAMALAFTVWFHDRKVGVIFLILAFLVGVARVAADVHYPFDIVGGAVIGLATAFVVRQSHLFVSRRKQ